MRQNSFLSAPGSPPDTGATELHASSRTAESAFECVGVLFESVLNALEAASGEHKRN